MRPTVIAAGFLLLASKAAAADLLISVRAPDGKPVANAVVTVFPASGAGALPARFAWPAQMVQHNLQFDPFVLVVPKGAEVAFPNQDKVRHHVYSFSATKRFELKLYGQGETRSVTFDKVGEAAVGCNIHDGMVGFIKVVDTPYAAKTDGEGQAVIRGLPAGAATVKTWHPYLRGAEIAQAVSLPRDGAVRQTVTAAVRTPPASHHAY